VLAITVAGVEGLKARLNGTSANGAASEDADDDAMSGDAGRDMGDGSSEDAAGATP
jgi:hypothetical protein